MTTLTKIKVLRNSSRLGCDRYLLMKNQQLKLHTHFSKLTSEQEKNPQHIIYIDDV